ncbi:MAG: hypothetical protein ACXW34_08615, partial [Nitrospira sp.]
LRSFFHGQERLIHHRTSSTTWRWNRSGFETAPPRMQKGQRPPGRPGPPFTEPFDGAAAPTSPAGRSTCVGQLRHTIPKRPAAEVTGWAPAPPVRPSQEGDLNSDGISE